MLLSVVVPLYNEEQNVLPMYTALTDALSELDFDYEVLFVDDGSRDSTYMQAYKIACEDKRLRLVKFRRNYGQTPAMAAGIDYSRGDIIVTMDGDLQNDPRDIGELVGQLENDYDIAVGWRFNRQDKVITRKIPSKIANWIIGRITGVPIKDNGCSLKAFRASVIKNIPLYSDMHRFIPAMASIAGARVVEIKVRHHARQFGESKYGLGRIYKVLVDLLSVKTLVSSASRPLLWFSIISVPAIVISCVCLISIFVEAAVKGNAIAGPIAGTGVLFGALGILMILTGALAELVFKTGDISMTTLAQLTMREAGGAPDVRMTEKSDNES